MIIRVDNKADREAVALIAIKNGYTVRLTTDFDGKAGKRYGAVEIKGKSEEKC